MKKTPSGLIIMNRPLLVPEREIAPMKSELGGRYRLRKFKGKTGKLIEDTGWFDNLITNIGLLRLATAGYSSYTYVGAGAATPSTANTGMASFIASTSANAPYGQLQDVYYATSPYYGYHIQTRRFAEGVAAGTIAEVGVGWEETSVGSLYSRALVLDSGGVPTTITVLSDEVLDVSYEHRVYMPMTSSAGSFVINGVTYNTVTRASDASSVGWAGQYLSIYGAVGASAPYLSVYNGTIGATPLDPIVGPSSGSSYSTWQDWVPGTKERKFIAQLNLTEGNLEGGINALKMNMDYTFGYYQTQLSAHIPKDSTKIMTLSGKVAWDRFTP